MADLAIALSPACPKPVQQYVRESLCRIGLEVEEAPPHNPCTLPRAILERHAEFLHLEVPLRCPPSKLCWSEKAFAVREFRVCNRTEHEDFSRAQRAFITLDYIERHLFVDELWETALVASGLADAAARPKREWLVGPGNEWQGQPLLSALRSLGFLAAATPLHGPGRYANLGLPQTARAFGRALLRARLIDANMIRAYWGEQVRAVHR